MQTIYATFVGSHGADFGLREHKPASYPSVLAGNRQTVFLSVFCHAFKVLVYQSICAPCSALHSCLLVCGQFRGRQGEIGTTQKYVGQFFPTETFLNPRRVFSKKHEYIYRFLMCGNRQTSLLFAGVSQQDKYISRVEWCTGQQIKILAKHKLERTQDRLEKQLAQ